MVGAAKGLSDKGTLQKLTKEDQEKNKFDKSFENTINTGKAIVLQRPIQKDVKNALDLDYLQLSRRQLAPKTGELVTLPPAVKELNIILMDGEHSNKFAIMHFSGYMMVLPKESQTNPKHPVFYY